MDKWWLLSDEDVAVIRAYLLTMALAGDDLAKDALHTLDSGLNTTDEVPDDWKEETEHAEMKKRELKARVEELEQRVAVLERDLEIARTYAEIMRGYAPYQPAITVPSPTWPEPYIAPQPITTATPRPVSDYTVWCGS